MAFPSVETYFSAIDGLRIYAGAAGPAVQEDALAQAVLNAYDSLTTEQHWRHFVTRTRLYFDVAYSTGTVEYDDDTKRLTLTSGTWPTYAASCDIKVGDIICKVDSRASDSVLVLDSTFNPKADVAAGATYALYRVNYALPDDMLGLFAILPEDNWIVPHHESGQTIFRRERYFQRSMNPSVSYTIEPDPTRMNGWQLRLFGYPTTAKTLDVLYLRQARELKYSGTETAAKAGTVTCEKSNVVDGSSTTFDPDMVGDMIVFGTSADLPGGRATTTKAKEQGRIKTYNGATSLDLWDVATKDHTAVKYRVTSPLDLPQPLLEAMRRCAEWKLEILRRGDMDKANARYRMELARAYGITGLKLDDCLSPRGGPWLDVPGTDAIYAYGEIDLGV